MDLDLLVLASANWIPILRFLLGFVGAFVYFISVKSGFVKIDPQPTNTVENPYLEKKEYLVFFCLVGGLLAVLFETNWLGSFVQGILIRPTIKGLVERGVK